MGVATYSWYSPPFYMLGLPDNLGRSQSRTAHLFREHGMSDSKSTSTAVGLGIGSVIAGLISWQYTQSVLWTLLHVFCGWFYVIWKLLEGKASL